MHRCLCMTLRPCVKRTHLVVTLRYTIRVFVTFSDCKESNANNRHVERCEV